MKSERGRGRRKVTGPFFHGADRRRHAQLAKPQCRLRSGKTEGQKLVHRVKGSRRYKADPSGVRAKCAYLMLRDKVIKPLLAGVVRLLADRPRSKPRSISTTSHSARHSTEI